MAEINPRTDRTNLTEKAYSSDEKLRVRILTHELYSDPKLNFQEWVLDRVVWRGDEQVLDVGMGSGSYFEEVLKRIPRGRYFAGDLSLGMARQARQRIAGTRVSVFNGDAQSLPLGDAQFDIVLANHMLYHVPDLDQALHQIRRVLKPGGQLIAATNSSLNMPEFEQLKWRALGRLGVAENNIDRYDPAVRGFALEDAARILHRYFYAVVRYDLPGALVFPDVQPVLDYLNSMRDLDEPNFPERINWDDYMAIMSEQVRRLIAHFGELTITKLSGVLIATQEGGFVQPYLSMLRQAGARA